MNANRSALVLGGLSLALLVMAGGCGDSGSPAGERSEPTTSNGPGTTATATSTRRIPVEGFGEIAYQVRGNPAQRCALLAESGLQHAQGLMNRRDLSGYDGMLFVFSTDTTGDFWMKDTPLPLSIAFFDRDGRFVSSTDMEPCVGQPSCPTYAAARAYRYALEVPKGGLGPLGIGPGTVITVGGACT